MITPLLLSFKNLLFSIVMNAVYETGNIVEICLCCISPSQQRVLLLNMYKFCTFDNLNCCLYSVLNKMIIVYFILLI